MANWLSNMRGFGRSGNKAPNAPNRPPNGAGGFGQSLSPSQSSLSTSPMPSPSATIDNPMSQENLNPSPNMSPNMNRKPPFFFREQYANLIVKGNFMTLAAKPVLVEEGEWLAHQVVEQNRLLDGMLKILQETDRNTGMPICNQHTCPSMTAGPGVTYTWAGKNGEPVRIPAPTYINYVQRWIAGKVTDPSVFPTDQFTSNPPALTPNQSSMSLSSGHNPDNWLGKASGFQPSYSSDIRNIYRQMLRCYAHIYHTHWLEFWHLGAYKELNTCFIHFVNVGRLFGLLNEKDLEPMGPLIDIWLEKGWLPRPQSSGGASQGAGSRNPSLADGGQSGAGGEAGGPSGGSPAI